MALAGDEEDAEGVPFAFAMRSGSTWRTMISLLFSSSASIVEAEMHTESMIQMFDGSSRRCRGMLQARRPAIMRLFGNAQRRCLFYLAQ